MKNLFPHAAASFALAISLASAPIPTRAETASSALEMVNLSARQRMLAQRMAGLSCLVHMGIDAETHASEALATQALFGETLTLLRNQNDSSNADPKNKAKVETALNLSQDQYNRMAGYLTSLETIGTVGPNRLEAIALTSNDLYEVSERLTNHIQASERQNLENLSLIRTMILNFSGRQRMLSEKAFKEFCLAEAGIDAQQNREALAQTSEIFDTTMNALINGMPGLIIAPPTAEIKAKLEEARNVWLPVKAVLERAASGEDFSLDDIHAATERLEDVRILMNEAVELYEAYDAATS
jgi:hypothetical protein